MKHYVPHIVWIWLLINIVLTLISTFRHGMMSRKKNLEELIFSEDKMNLKLSLINASREILESFLGLSGLAFLFYLLKDFTFFKFNWTWSHFFLCLLVADFLYFISHLAGHKIQFFWNYHSVHHNSEEYSLSTGFRVSWIKFVFDWIFYVPIAFVGFPPEMILASMAIITSYTHLLHTKNIQSVPIYEYILNTPKAHRIHHSSHEMHIDKNMGGILMVWDMLFKTFSLKYQDVVVYGLTSKLERNDLIFINFAEWKTTYTIFRTMGLKTTLQYLINNPMNNKNIVNDANHTFSILKADAVRSS